MPDPDGLLYSCVGKYNESLELLNRVLLTDPENIELCLESCRTRPHRQVCGTLAVIEKIHAIDHLQSDAWYLKGFFLYHRGDLIQALPCLTEALDSILVMLKRGVRRGTATIILGSRMMRWSATTR